MLRRLLRFLFGPPKTTKPLRDLPSSMAERDYSQAPGNVSAPGITAASSLQNRRAASAVDARETGTKESGLDTSRFAPLSVSEALTVTGVTGWRLTILDSRHEIP